MQKYPVRQSHRAGLTAERLEEVARTHFDGAERQADGVHAHYGAIREIVVRPEGRELAVDLAMDPKVTPDVAAATIQRYNRFLEEATGYSSKERAKRLKKSPSGSESGA